MKKLATGIAVIALIGTPALAADMVAKAPPIPSSPVQGWNGLYVGIDGGGGWNDPTGDRFCVNPNGRLFGAGCGENAESHVVRPGGGFVGGTAGYNYQSGSIVYGIETDLQWSGIKASGTMPVINPPGGIAYTATYNIDWFGTTRGRIGLLATPNLCSTAPVVSSTDTSWRLR